MKEEGKVLNPFMRHSNSFQIDERVGRHTFALIVKLLTRRGEAKAGLSTYYISLRYSGNIFISMMKRLASFSIEIIILLDKLRLKLNH